MRRLPPNKIEQNITGLTNILPNLTEQLLQRIDQPLKEDTDPETVNLYFLFMLIYIYLYYCIFNL